MGKETETRAGNLNVRITPSSKFAIDFAARVMRKSVTQLITEAVLPVADDAKFKGRTWRDYDDPTPGYAECLMYLHGLPMSKEEDEIRRFVLTHREFFFDGDEPSRRRLDVLWSKVPHYADSYFRKMKTDNLSAGHEMNKALVEAKRKPVKWPPEDDR